MFESNFSYHSRNYSSIRSAPDTFMQIQGSLVVHMYPVLVGKQGSDWPARSGFLLSAYVRYCLIVGVICHRGIAVELRLEILSEIRMMHGNCSRCPCITLNSANKYRT